MHVSSSTQITHCSSWSLITTITQKFLRCVILDFLFLSHGENLGSYGKPPLIFCAEFIFAICFYRFLSYTPPWSNFENFSLDREKFTRLRTQFFLLIWRSPPDRGKFSASEKSALLCRLDELSSTLKFLFHRPCINLSRLLPRRLKCLLVLASLWQNLDGAKSS